jgi:hypothetical protein
MFKAWLVTKTDTQYAAALTQLDESQLPDGDVTVRVALHSNRVYAECSQWVSIAKCYVAETLTCENSYS